MNLELRKTSMNKKQYLNTVIQVLYLTNHTRNIIIENSKDLVRDLYIYKIIWVPWLYPDMGLKTGIQRASVHFFSKYYVNANKISISKFRIRILNFHNMDIIRMLQPIYNFIFISIYILKREKGLKVTKSRYIKVFWQFIRTNKHSFLNRLILLKQKIKMYRILSTF